MHGNYSDEHAIDLSGLKRPFWLVKLTTKESRGLPETSENKGGSRTGQSYIRPDSPEFYTEYTAGCSAERAVICVDLARRLSQSQPFQE